MQTIIIIVLVLFGISLLNFFRDRNKMLETGVDAYGGMMVKYKTIIQTLSSDPLAKISAVRRDSVIIDRVENGAIETFIVTHSLNDVEISWYFKGRNHTDSANWSFPSNYDQNDILEKIRKDIIAKSYSIPL